MDESKHEIHSQVDAITAGTASVVNLTAGQWHWHDSAECAPFVCLDLPQFIGNNITNVDSEAKATLCIVVVAFVGFIMSLLGILMKPVRV